MKLILRKLFYQKLLGVGIIVFTLCRPARASELDDSITRARFTYRTTIQFCLASPNAYRRTAYTHFFSASLNNSIQIVGLSPMALVKMISDRGMTPALYSYLDDDTLTLALADCFGSKQQADLFVFNLLTINAVAETIGLTAGVFGWIEGSAAIQPLLRPLDSIMPGFSAIALRTVGVVASSVATNRLVNHIWQNYKPSKDTDADQKSKDESSALVKQLQQTHFDAIEDNAQHTLQLITKDLSQKDLTDSERQALLKQQQDWQLIADAYKH